MPNEDQPQVPEAFFFKLEAGENGLTELTFRKDADKVMGTLLATGLAIVESFDPDNRPPLGEFFRLLGDMADEFERIQNERTQTNDSQRTAEEIHREETGDGVCLADGDLRAECNQGRVPETRH